MRGFSARTVVAIMVAGLSSSVAPLPSRAGWAGTPLSGSSTMPAPFSFATARDALAATYPSYVRSLGIARSLRTTDGDAAHVSVLEARPWYAGRKPYLVVAIARQTDDQAARTELCGACWERFAIAVLAEHDGTLRLVARTHDDGPTEADPVPAGVEALLSVKGDGIASLDLAPYDVSSREVLIGLRNTVSITGGNFGTTLVLFRIVRNDLKAVAYFAVGGGTNEPTQTLDHATVSVIKRPGTYNDLRVLSSHYNDAARDESGWSDEPRPGTKPDDADLSTFRFDGTRFHEIGGAQHERANDQSRALAYGSAPFGAKPSSAFGITSISRDCQRGRNGTSVAMRRWRRCRIATRRARSNASDEAASRRSASGEQ
jgi:hypothetical protein